jgi:hypothetical protein
MAIIINMGIFEPESGKVYPNDLITLKYLSQKTLDFLNRYNTFFIENIYGTVRMIVVEFNESPNVLSPKDFTVKVTTENGIQTFNSSDVKILYYYKETNTAMLYVPRIDRGSCVYSISYNGTPEKTTRMTCVEDVSLTKNTDNTYTIRGYVHNADYIDIRYTDSLQSAPIHTINKEDFTRLSKEDKYYYSFELVVNDIPIDARYLNVLCGKSIENESFPGVSNFLAIPLSQLLTQ